MDESIKFDVSIDSDPYSKTYWYQGTVELEEEEFEFTVATDQNNYVLEINWLEKRPTEDPVLLHRIRDEICANFGRI